MPKTLLSLIKVLQAGESLSDPAVWKSRQLLANAVIGVLGTIAGLSPDMALSDGDMQTLAWALALIGWAVNSYLTLATSEKVGFKKRG